jgi:hypothetical protein
LLTDLDFIAYATELAYGAHADGASVALMPGYQVDRVFACEVAKTGFDAVAFVNLEAQKLIVAIRGSDSAIDFVADANLGIAQYLANRDALVAYVGGYIATFGVTIAGHSLGGGLGQYLCYDVARTFPDLRQRLALQTHNSFGGILGISRIHGGYDPAVFDGVAVRNFRHPDDPVSRIGGQAGGNVLEVVDVNPLVHDGVMFAHSNNRFLPRGDVSMFDGALPGEDRQIDLTRTMLELGPEISEAVSQLITRGSKVTALAQVYRLILRLPAAERDNVLALLNELLPFRGLWQRSFGWLTRRRRPDSVAPIAPKPIEEPS